MALTTESNRRGPDAALASAQDIPGRRLLSRYEERALSDPIDGGDQAARNRLVEANLGLVVTIARQFLGRGLELDDLTGEGNLGLIRAAEEFDPRFGTRFGTYASYWIKAAIRRALINTTTTIRLPAHMVGLLTKWQRAERALFREAARAPTFEEIASFLGLSEVQKSLVAKARRVRQLKQESRYGGESGSRLFNEATDGHRPIDERLEADEEQAVAFRRMGRLDDRERATLVLRYGLEGEILTFKEIGRRLGVTREWARKIEIRALRKLGHAHGQEAESCRVGNRNGPAKRLERPQARLSFQALRRM